jgi:hypothetical protein
MLKKLSYLRAVLFRFPDWFILIMVLSMLSVAPSSGKQLHEADERRTDRISVIKHNKIRRIL